MPRHSINRLVLQSARPRVTAGSGVVLLKLAPEQAAWQQHIYQLALAKAKAALAPPRYIGRFLASMN